MSVVLQVLGVVAQMATIEDAGLNRVISAQLRSSLPVSTCSRRTNCTGDGAPATLLCGPNHLHSPQQVLKESPCVVTLPVPEKQPQIQVRRVKCAWLLTSTL